MAAAPDSTLSNPKLRPETNRNSDGLVDIENDLRPVVERLLAEAAGSGSPFLDPADEPARSISDVVAGFGRPVLVLHGAQDGYVPVTDGEAVARAAPDRVTLRRYPDLCHALSVTENPAEDAFTVAYIFTRRHWFITSLSDFFLPVRAARKKSDVPASRGQFRTSGDGIKGCQSVLPAARVVSEALVGPSAQQHVAAYWG